jgi:hypothetical protein
MNRKIPTTIAISIVLIVAILAGGFIYWRYFSFQEELANQPEIVIPEKPIDETANWQTYTNDQYGFEIKYPKKFFPEVPSNQDLNIGLLTLSFNENGYYPIWLYVGGNENKKILDMINSTSTVGLEVKNNKKTINGLEWNIVEETEIPVEGIGTAGSALKFYTLNGNRTYIIECLDCNSQIFGDIAEEKRLTFDQMLSTFKFIGTDETANEENYSDKTDEDFNIKIDLSNGEFSSDDEFYNYEKLSGLDYYLKSFIYEKSELCDYEGISLMITRGDLQEFLNQKSGWQDFSHVENYKTIGENSFWHGGYEFTGAGAVILNNNIIYRIDSSCDPTECQECTDERAKVNSFLEHIDFY